MDKLRAWVNTYVDKKTIVNGVIAGAVFGGIVYAAKKSKIGIAKKAATVATGGK